MSDATSLLAELSLLLINVAAASLLSCTCVGIASFLLRRKSLPLRHVTLLSAAMFALVSPVLVYFAGQFEWGLVPIEINQPAADAASLHTPQRLPNDTIDADFAPDPQTVTTTREQNGDRAGDALSAAERPPAAGPTEFLFVTEDMRSSDHSDNTLQQPLFTSPRESVQELSADDASAAALSTSPLDIVAEGPAFAPAALRNWRVTASCILIATWFAGSMLLLLRLLRGMLVVRRLRRSLTATAEPRILRLFDRATQGVGISWQLKLHHSPLAPAPLSLGLMRPTVVLPTGLSDTLSDDQLCSILAHESAHVLRRDNLTALMQQLAAAMFWWNPLLHRINRTANRLREQICDDYVVNSLGHGRAFAEALVKVAEWCVFGRLSMPAVALLIGKPAELPARVHRLTQGSGSTVLRLGRSAILALAAIVCCGFGLLMIPVLRPTQAAQEELQPAAQPPLAADEPDRRSNPTERDQLEDNDRFPQLIVATVLSELKAQQPSLMATELSRRVERRFQLLLEYFQTSLNNRNVEWRQALIASLEKSIRLQFNGGECRDGNQPSATFFDRLKTLEWKLWMAASRLDHLESSAPRNAQQEWLQKHILSLPPLRSQNGRVLYDLRQAILDYEALAADPLEPICKTAMTDAQFAEFQQKMLAYDPGKEIQYVVAHIVRHEGWARYSTPPGGGKLYPAIQLPFQDDVASLGHRNHSLQLTFRTPDYSVADRVQPFRHNRDGNTDSTVQTAVAPEAAIAQHNAERAKLEKAVRDAQQSRDRSLQPGFDHVRCEQQYLMAQLRLDQFDLALATGSAGLPIPPHVTADEIARLREATRIRWGRPNEGLQVGFGRLHDRTQVAVGETIPFQLYVRNALDEPLTRTVKYRSAEAPTAAIDCNGRITVTTNSVAEMQGPVELQLQPGEIQALEKGKCLLNTGSLTPGNYYIECYMIVTWPKGPDESGVHLARAPGWTEIPGDLAMRFELTGEPQATTDLAQSGQLKLQSLPGVSWGAPVQGLQSGVRYVRGMKTKNFNDVVNWEWSDGDLVESEILVRNVSNRPRTISYTPMEGVDHQILDATDCSVTEYDNYSALMRRTRVVSDPDQTRTIVKVLQPGDNTIVARQDFEVRQLPEELSQMRDYPKANRIWVNVGERYWYRPRIAVSMSENMDASLHTGKLRLWTTDSQTATTLNTAEAAPPGTGTVSLTYDSFGAAPRATFLFTPLNRDGESLAKEAGNGEPATVFSLPAGTYRVTRLITARSGELSRTFECNPQVVTVEPDQQTDVRLNRDPAHLVTAQHRIEGWEKHNLKAAFVTVYQTDDVKLNTGDPADYFDFLAEREPLFATVCNENGEFRIEPLPPGRYVASITGFRTSQDASGNSVLVLPWLVGCETFQIMGHSQAAYWYPNEVKLYVEWNEPTWLPQVAEASTVQDKVDDSEPVSTQQATVAADTVVAEAESNTAAAQPDAGDDETATSSGEQDEPPAAADDKPWQIIDSNGAPVTGATVRLIHQTETFRELVTHRLLHETTTDASGRFDLPDGKLVANAMDEGGLSATWVTVPGRDGTPERTWLLGTSAGAVSPMLDGIFNAFGNPETRTPLVPPGQSTRHGFPRIMRLPDQVTPLRVINPDGSPAVGVTVTPTQLVWIQRNSSRKRIVVPDILRSSLAQVTDTDGRVTFSTIDRMEFAELECQSEQHGLQRTFTNDNTIGPELAKDLMLFPVGRVEGRIIASRPADREFLKGQSFLLKSKAINQGVRVPKGWSIAMEGFAEVTLDADGHFEIPAMAIGKLTLSDRLPADSDSRVVFPERKVVTAGETTDVEGRVIATVAVQGVLRKRGSNEPIPSAAISIRHGKQSGISRELTVYSRTDDKGRFEARVFPGRIGYSSMTVIEGFVQAHETEQTFDPDWPYGKHATVPDNVESFALEPIELLPIAPVTGKVIDAAGIPVANTGVYSRYRERQDGNDFAKTNEAGEFTLTRTPAAFPPNYFRVGEQFKTKAARIVSRNPLVIQAVDTEP